MKLLEPHEHLAARHGIGARQWAVFGAVFAAAGVAVVLVTSAAGTPVAFEAESGTLAGGATVTSMAGQSGSGAVKFGAGATPTPTPTSTPTAGGCIGAPDTPGGPDPWGGCWPGPQNTGYPHGLPGDSRPAVTLRTVKVGDSGPGWRVETVGGGPVMYIDQAGAVVDGLDINNIYVHIIANNVTIKRSRITNGGYYAMFIGDLPTTFKGLTLEDVELNGTRDTTNFTIAINASENATYRRVNVYNMASSGPRLATGTLMEDSWIHDFAHGTDGHEAGLSSNDDASGMILRHNNVSINTEGASSAIALYRDFGKPDNVLIEKNLLNGGNYGIMTGIQASDGSYPPVNNIRFLNNRMGREFNAECGKYAPYAQFSSTNGTGNVWSGNTWGGGAAATSAHVTGAVIN